MRHMWNQQGQEKILKHFRLIDVSATHKTTDSPPPLSAEQKTAATRTRETVSTIIAHSIAGGIPPTSTEIERVRDLLDYFIKNDQFP